MKPCRCVFLRGGMDFTFSLATPADDAAIRHLLATSPVPGSVTLAYAREPNYFWGCATLGSVCQVVVGRPAAAAEVAAVLCRAVRPVFINGQVEQVGYISQLRVAEKYQGRWLVQQGAEFLRTLCHADQVSGHWTTLIEGNPIAQRILTRRPRGQMPVLRELDRLCTLALILRRGPLAAAPPGATLAPATPADLPELVAFLQQPGAARQFFPVYSAEDFNGPRLRDFHLADLVIARRRAEIVGVLGLWDQSGYKQSVVQAYGGSLRWGRPWYNLGARLWGAAPLPRPGQAIRLAYACCLCVAADQPALFGALLHQVYHLAAQRGYGYLMLGLVERDPLLAVARRYPHIPYYSRMYTLTWPEDPNFHDRLDGRLPYLELASL